MKHLRTPAVLAFGLVALMALAATAAATTVTSTTGGAGGTPSGHAVNEGGHITMANAVANISCASTIEGNIESHGSGVTAAGKNTKIEFTGCTNSWHVTTTSAGSLEVHWTSGHNGLVTSTGTKIDSTRLGVTCVYQTNATTMGTMIGGNPATIKLEGSIPINTGESSGLCGSSSSKIEGSYSSTSAGYVAP